MNKLFFVSVYGEQKRLVQFFGNDLLTLEYGNAIAQFVLDDCLFLIWYKESFRVPDMNFNPKKRGSPSPFSYLGNQSIRVYIA